MSNIMPNSWSVEKTQFIDTRVFPKISSHRYNMFVQIINDKTEQTNKLSINFNTLPRGTTISQFQNISLGKHQNRLCYLEEIFAFLEFSTAI